MFGPIRERMTFANVMSCVAVFVAMGGTGYAAVKIPRNSVSAAQIKTGGVASSEVKNGSLRSLDFKAGELPAGARGEKGETGATGPAGPAGADGADGAPGENGSADAFARVLENGTLQGAISGFPAQTKGGILVSKGESGASTGNYCFDLPFRPASAVVSLDNADAAAADRNLVASVAIDRGEDLGDCPANRNDARVRIVDGNTAAAQDAKFFIWFEG